MRPDDVVMALDWAAAEGWNPGLHDHAPFPLADPAGFLIALRDDEPVSMIAATRYGADYGFIGFYITRPEQRGQGLGLAIWQAGMLHLSGRLIGLDGVLAQQGNYRTSGFVLAQRNARHEGKAASAALPELPPGQHLRALAEVPRQALHAYDRAFFPAPPQRDACDVRDGPHVYRRCAIELDGSHLRHHQLRAGLITRSGPASRCDAVHCP